MAGGPVAASKTRVRSCSATGVHLTSRFEDYSRCARPWAERSDGMTSAIIRPAYRTSIALLKPIARILRLLRGIHALLSNLREASESSHYALHGPDRSISPSHCISGPR